MMKRIGIITTGGDCAGLNSTIYNLVKIGVSAGHKMIGILSGMDGLTCGAPQFVELNLSTIPPYLARIAGSFIGNSGHGAAKYECGDYGEFKSRAAKSLRALKLDALIIIGGNGSLSLANSTREIYGNVQLIGIPKTIDMDVPMTDITIGFDTAVQQMTEFCDAIMTTARSHSRWFVVQSMGRDSGFLALHSGVAVNADAILIPEIKFNPDDLAKHIKKIEKNGRHYGIIMVSESVKLRGHSGKSADMIARELIKRGINARTAFPEHFMRGGDAVATDRVLSAQFATAAFSAISNNETYVMVTMHQGAVKIIPIDHMIKRGKIKRDPNVKDKHTANAIVPDDYPVLLAAAGLGIFIG